MAFMLGQRTFRVRQMTLMLGQRTFRAEQKTCTPGQRPFGRGPRTPRYRRINYASQLVDLTGWGLAVTAAREARFGSRLRSSPRENRRFSRPCVAPTSRALPPVEMQV